MRRFGAVLVIAASAVVASFASAADAAAVKPWICHKADENRYVAVRVTSRAQLRGHVRHGDIVAGVPQTRAAARAFCRGLAITPTRGGRRFDATLAPVSAALTGSGNFTFRAAQGRETLCWRLTIQSLASSAGPVTAAHIHGPRPSTDIFIPITLTAAQLTALNASLASGQTATTTGCETVDRAKVRQLLRNIDDFYVNVHTTAFPGGALQGTLSS
jgi:CHRD domain